MSYTPNTWETGDTITAEKLNNMESGIEAAGGVLKVVMSKANGVYTLDKTAGEIIAALRAGKYVPVCFDTLDGEDDPTLIQSPITTAEKDTHTANYIIEFAEMSFVAITLNDYPTVNI